MCLSHSQYFFCLGRNAAPLSKPQPLKSRTFGTRLFSALIYPSNTAVSMAYTSVSSAKPHDTNPIPIGTLQKEQQGFNPIHCIVYASLLYASVSPVYCSTTLPVP